MQEKTCTKCGVSKTLDEFRKAKFGKFGRSAVCKKCNNLYYQQNKDHILQKSRKWKNDNPEQRKLSNLKYRHSARGKQLKYNYESTHLDEKREYNKTYRQHNIEYFRRKKCEYHHIRMKTDPNYRIESRFRVRIRQALKTNAKHTTSKELLGCTIEEFKLHLQETAILNGYLNFDINNYSSDEYHIDHIIPCSSFDLTDPEQQKQCFHYTNQQILTSYENLRKSDKVGN